MAWQTAPLHRRELQAGQCGVWTVDRKRLSVVVRRSDVKSRTGSRPIRSLFETASAVPRAGLRQSRGMHPNVRVCLPPEPTFRPGSTPPRHVALARNVGLGRIGRIATLTEPCRMRALAARAGANARKTAATDGSRRPIWLRLPTLATRLLVRWCGSYGPPCPIVNRSEALLVIRISRLAVSNGSNHQKGVAHAWSAVAAKPIRPPTFAAVQVRRLPTRRPGVACRTGRRIGREGLHRASCLRPLIDPVPVPGWLHGRRRPPDRGDGQLHRGGDDA